jgi:hypothetical protein
MSSLLLSLLLLLLVMVVLPEVLSVPGAAVLRPDMALLGRLLAGAAAALLPAALLGTAAAGALPLLPPRLTVLALPLVVRPAGAAVGLLLGFRVGWLLAAFVLLLLDAGFGLLVLLVFCFTLPLALLLLAPGLLLPALLLPALLVAAAAAFTAAVNATGSTPGSGLSTSSSPAAARRVNLMFAKCLKTVTPGSALSMSSRQVSVLSSPEGCSLSVPMCWPRMTELCRNRLQERGGERAAQQCDEE